MFPWSNASNGISTIPCESLFLDESVCQYLVTEAALPWLTNEQLL